MQGGVLMAGGEGIATLVAGFASFLWMRWAGYRLRFGHASKS
jgi:hypothetical protein